MPAALDALMLARCRRIGTSTWSDALDALGLDGVIDGLTVRSGPHAVAAGVAVTAKERVQDLDADAVPSFDIAGILAALHRDTVLVIDSGGACVSTFGGLAAMAAERAGASGVVLDGACRDIGEVLRSGLWLATRHVTPRSGKGRIVVEAIDVPVRVGGVEIAPGDLIIGDATGVLRIPVDRLDDALVAAEELARRDARFAALLHTMDFAGAVKQVGPA